MMSTRSLMSGHCKGDLLDLTFVDVFVKGCRPREGLMRAKEVHQVCVEDENSQWVWLQDALARDDWTCKHCVGWVRLTLQGHLPEGLTQYLPQGMSQYRLQSCRPWAPKGCSTRQRDEWMDETESSFARQSIFGPTPSYLKALNGAQGTNEVH